MSKPEFVEIPGGLLVPRPKTHHEILGPDERPVAKVETKAFQEARAEVEAFDDTVGKIAALYPTLPPTEGVAMIERFVEAGKSAVVSPTEILRRAYQMLVQGTPEDEIVQHLRAGTMAPPPPTPSVEEFLESLGTEQDRVLLEGTSPIKDPVGILNQEPECRVILDEEAGIREVQIETDSLPFYRPQPGDQIRVEAPLVEITSHQIREVFRTPDLSNLTTDIRAGIEERLAIMKDPSRSRSERRRAQREVDQALDQLQRPGLVPQQGPNRKARRRRARRSA